MIFEESIIDRLQRIIKEQELNIINGSDQQMHIDEELIRKNERVAKIYFDDDGNVTSCVIIDGTDRKH